MGAKTYNHKLARLLPEIQDNLPGTKIVYADMYTPLINMITRPEKYGKFKNFVLDYYKKKKKSEIL